jgi:hypothetical protein
MLLVRNIARRLRLPKQRCSQQWGPPQLCEFHIRKELTQAVLRAVTQVRKDLAARKPPRKRGRPSTQAALRAGRHRERLQPRMGALFAHRFLFVHHDLTPPQPRTLPRLTRGLPQLRTLRAMREEGYRWFERRCRTDTALAKLAQLRPRGRRDKHVGTSLNKLRSPHLEQARTLLDAPLLPSTSNAVERGHRRSRKMQKPSYRVRTQQHLHNRIALDLWRDSQKDDRTNTLKTLHRDRANSG